MVILNTILVYTMVLYVEKIIVWLCWTNEDPWVKMPDTVGQAAGPRHLFTSPLSTSPPPLHRSTHLTCLSTHPSRLSTHSSRLSTHPSHLSTHPSHLSTHPPPACPPVVGVWERAGTSGGLAATRGWKTPVHVIKKNWVCQISNTVFETLWNNKMQTNLDMHMHECICMCMYMYMCKCIYLIH